MIIRVTHDDIKHGLKNECMRCPIARAIERHTGLTARVSDNELTVNLFASRRDAANCRQELIALKMTDPMIFFVSEFDRGYDVMPFAFDIDALTVLR